MIDRSKPLSIHELPSLIDEVARLKELAKEEASATYKQAGDEFGYECAVLNAAPKLLNVLGMIRAGDADEMRWMIDFFSANPARYANNIEVLHRYRDMARKMEENR